MKLNGYDAAEALANLFKNSLPDVHMLLYEPVSPRDRALSVNQPTVWLENLSWRNTARAFDSAADEIKVSLTVVLQILVSNFDAGFQMIKQLVERIDGILSAGSASSWQIDSWEAEAETVFLTQGGWGFKVEWDIELVNWS